jgi:disulfide oxidoreductase YuzD
MKKYVTAQLDILDKIIDEVGNEKIVESCKKNGITPKTFYIWLEDNIKYKRRYEAAKYQSIDEYNKELVEEAKGCLLDKVREGNFPAVKFALEQGKLIEDAKIVLIRKIADNILNILPKLSGKDVDRLIDMFHTIDKNG